MAAVNGSEDELKAALSNVYKLCDKAVSKGILHKNTAARKKSRLTIAINKTCCFKIVFMAFLPEIETKYF